MTDKIRDAVFINPFSDSEFVVAPLTTLFEARHPCREILGTPHRMTFFAIVFFIDGEVQYERTSTRDRLVPGGESAGKLMPHHDSGNRVLGIKSWQSLVKVPRRPDFHLGLPAVDAIGRASRSTRIGVPSPRSSSRASCVRASPTTT